MSYHVQKSAVPGLRNRRVRRAVHRTLKQLHAIHRKKPDQPFPMAVDMLRKWLEC